MSFSAIANQAPDFQRLRAEATDAFLRAHKASTERKLLVEEASARKFYRVQQDGKNVVFLDSPNPDAPQERLRNVVTYSEILNDIGLRAPKVYAVDYEQGFALLEDFGDDVLTALFDRGEDKAKYLTPAMDALVHLHRNLDPGRMQALGNDMDYWTWENPYFTNWYWPARNNHETPPDLVAEYLGLWKQLLEKMPSVEKTMCMTDYHAPNIMHLAGESGIRSVGIIDFQDALLATPIYDVMSLLEDDRRDLDDETGFALRKRYRDAMADKIDPELFDLHYAVSSAQRHAKNMGNFVRIATQKKAPRWLDYVPQATKWFDRALHSHDYLAPMQKWFARHCPDYREPLQNVRFFL